MKKILSMILVLCFAIQQVGLAQFAVGPVGQQLPIAGPRTDRYRPMHLRHVSIQPATKALRVSIDRGDAVSLESKTVAASARTLLEFFLIGISLPNDAFWVNLRPDTANDVIDPRLEKTDMGRILLEADLQLKKDMALLTSPDTETGRNYWKQLYAKAEELFGNDTAEIPALTRPWIVPKEVIIAQSASGAYVYKATLDVMLEQDYLKGQVSFSFDDPRFRKLNEFSSEIVRRSILPRLVLDVNTARRYAPLRQVYYSLILAQWFKQNYAGKSSKAAHPFVARINTGNLDGLVSKSSWSKSAYFQAYQKSFQQGEYNKQEQIHTASGVTIRSYFSGGAVLDAQSVLKSSVIAAANNIVSSVSKHNIDLTVEGVLPTNFTMQAFEQTSDKEQLTRDGGLVSETDESIKTEIQRLIAGKETILVDLIKRYNEATSPEAKKEIEKSINSVVDLVNAFEQYEVNDLKMANVEKLDDFLASPQAGAFADLAKETLLDGRYVPEFIFAGAATRLFDSLKTILEDENLNPKDYRMYNLDLWDVVRILKDNIEKVKKHNPELVPVLERTEVPADRESLGMGARQIATYKKFIEGLAVAAGKDPAQVLRKQSIVLHINQEVADTVIEDFIANDFYGFDRTKVFFIVQPVYGGYQLTDKGLVFDQSSAKLPYGHGFVAMQLTAVGEGFTVNAYGDRAYLTESVMDYLTATQKARIIGTHRVNDLSKFLLDDVASVEKIAFSLYQIKQGKNMVVELVENPGGQKGGNLSASKSANKKFLIETSNTNGSQALTAMIEAAAEKGAEYNAMRVNAEINAYKDILLQGIPYNLRFKNGLFYLESVQGDSTQSSLASVEAFVKSKELIHDFKELKNLPEAIDFLTTAGYFNYFTPGEMIAKSKERSVVLGIINGRPELRGLWNYVEKSFKNGDINDWDQAYQTLVRVDQWLADPLYAKLFPKLVSKLEQLIKENDWETVTESFYKELGFGTAGKRGHQVQEATGEVLPGVNVINDYTVAEFALGLAKHIQALEKQNPGISQRGIVIGGDTRIKSIMPYNDEESYAHLAAKILRRMGVRVYLFSGPRSIAEVSWLTTKRGALGMIYVSASHNYWYDNGIKSSNEFGAQLFPNEKEAILAEMGPVSIKDIDRLDLDKIDLRVERSQNPNDLVLVGSESEKVLGSVKEDVDSEYIKVNEEYKIDKAMVGNYANKVVSFFTPVQGAGKFTVGAILKGLGYSNTVISAIQNEQDSQGRFDTVPKPDPAHVEDGVRTLDVAIAEAEAHERVSGSRLDFVVGTDPDADRSAYAVRNNDGRWAVLKANDVWSLFTWYILSQRKAQNKLPAYLIKTWVTSDLIKGIAGDIAPGLDVFEPAVGFDKIAQVALKEIALPQFYKNHNLGTYGKEEKAGDLSLNALVSKLEARGEQGVTSESIITEINRILKEQLAFGAEESNGFSPGGHTLEKDGAVAVVIFHEIAAFVKAINANKSDLSKLIEDNDMRSILDEYFTRHKELDIYNLFNALYLRYGYYATANIPLEFPGLTGNQEKEKVLDRIEKVAAAMQKKEQKLTFGNEEVDSVTSGTEATKCNDVVFNEVGFKFALGGNPENWVTTRPSGTEPYIRFYSQIKVDKARLTWDTVEKTKEDADKAAVQLSKNAQEAFARDGGKAVKDLFAAAGEQDKNNLPADNLFRDIGFEDGSARLGWVIPPAWEQIEPLLKSALEKKVFQKKRNIVFSGMGGSINTVKAIINYFGRGDTFKNYAIDSLDPAAAAVLLQELAGNLEDTAVVGISKTTTTAETRKLLKTMRQAFADSGLDYQGRFAWMSDPGNYNKVAEGVHAEDRWPDAETMPIQPQDEDIGGRFTAPHTFIFLLPLLLSLNKDASKLEKIWNEYVVLQEKRIPEVEQKAITAAESNAQYFAVVVENKKMAKALETWIIQLFQESLGSKQSGFNPKVVVVTKDQLKDYKDFTPVSFDIPSGNDAVIMMTTMYLSQLFVALLAHEKKINFVIQPEVEKYKKEASAIVYQPAKTVDMEMLKSSVRSRAAGKKFIEVVCYWFLSDAQRGEIARELRAEFPDKTVLVFEGSDWNHHSYQAATMNEETLFVVLTRDAYTKHVEGIPDSTLAENTQNLLDIAYATYTTLKDKAVYFGLRSVFGNLRDSNFDLTERPASERFQGLVRNGLTPEKNNPINGAILSPGKDSWVDLQDENSLQVQEMAKKGIDTKVAFAYSAGGLAMRGGGLFHAGFAFPSDLPVIGGKTFTDIKLDMAQKAQAPVVIMTSTIRLDAVANALGTDYSSLRQQVLDKGYATVTLKRNGQEQKVFVYCQGLQRRITPQDSVLEGYLEKAIAKKAAELGEDSVELADYSAKLKAGVAFQKGKAGQPVLVNDGSPVVNPPGHFDFIRYLAISGVLGELKSSGVELVFHSNMNNPAAHVTDYIKGAFKQQIEKGRQSGNEPLSMFLLGENRGEKGGLLADVDYADGRKVTQLVEGIALTDEAATSIDAAAEKGELAKVFPYFNTATFLLNVDGLMKFFGLEDNYQSVMSKEEIIATVDAVTAKMPVYMDLKEQDDGTRILLGYQLERIYGDLTAVAPWVPAVVNRDIHFIPTKEEADIRNSAKMAQLEDVIGSVLGKKSADGGKTVGGVDLRHVPGIASLVLVKTLPVFAEKSNVSLDLDKQWQQIVTGLSNGTLPEASCLVGYLAACCKSKQSGRPVNGAISDIAEIMRAQEDQVCATAPELKEALAYLSS